MYYEHNGRVLIPDDFAMGQSRQPNNLDPARRELEAQ